MQKTIINHSRGYGLNAPGFGFDLRPGINPREWNFVDTYAWPVPKGPQPITLMPAIIAPEWETIEQDAGPFSRYRMDHFDIISGSAKEYPRLHQKDWGYLTKQAADTEFQSKTFLKEGQGLSIHFNSAGARLTNKRIMEIRFGHTDPTKKLNLIVYENGRGYLSRGTPTDFTPLAEGALVPNRWGSIVGHFIKLFIHPFGQNRVLITSSSGHGFMYEDKRIKRVSDAIPHGYTPDGSALHSLTGYPPAMKTAPYNILLHTRAWVQPRPTAFTGQSVLADDGRKYIYGTLKPVTPALVEVTRLSLNLGLLTSSDHYDRIGPKGLSAKTTHTKNELTNGKTQLVPIVTLKRPDAEIDHENHTPQFYRNEVKYAPTLQTGLDESDSYENDMIRLEQKRDKDSATGMVEFRNGKDTSIIQRKFNIPFAIVEDGNVWFQGMLIAPSMEDLGDDQERKLTTQKILSFQIQDEMRYLDSAYVADQNRLDGLGIDDAVKQLLISVGFPADGSKWDIDSVPITLSGEKLNKLSIAAADDDPTNLADVLKTVGDWIRYIVDTYTSAATFPFKWVYGFQPYFNLLTKLWEYRFFLKNPDKISIKPVKTWWHDPVWAENPPDGSTKVSFDMVHMSIHKHYKEETIEPECNELLIYGIEQDFFGSGDDPDLADHDEGTLIKRYYFDKDSIDGSLPIAKWPPNHFGYRKLGIYFDGSLNTAELVQQAGGKIFPRVSRARVRATIQAYWEPSVRLWDTVTTWHYVDVPPHPDKPEHKDNFISYDWKVTGFDVEHLQDNPNIGLYQVRPATYYLERWLS